LINRGVAYMEQLAPKYLMPSDWGKDDVTITAVLKSLRITDRDLSTSISLMLVNTGNRFIVIGVKDGITLRSLKPDFDLISVVSKKLHLIGYYVFTTDRNATDKDATTRMFALRDAIKEEWSTARCVRINDGFSLGLI
jgi:predicted PhzF superfamily epimerase YddE/YHI9